LLNSPDSQAGLQTKVLNPDVIEYALSRFEEELRRAADLRAATIHRSRLKRKSEI
jgi:hypothetical protein